MTKTTSQPLNDIADVVQEMGIRLTGYGTEKLVLRIRGAKGARVEIEMEGDSVVATSRYLTSRREIARARTSDAIAMGTFFRRVEDACA